MNGITKKKLLDDLENECERLHNSTRTDIPFLSPAHNYLRSKSDIYYRWSSSPTTSTVHKAGVVAFIVSFIFFITLQFLYPDYFSGKPKEGKGVSFKLEEPKTREVTWEQYKQWRQNVKDVEQISLTMATAKIYAGAVQYLDDDGQWKDIDTNIKTEVNGKIVSGETVSGQKNKPVFVKEAPYKSYFSTNLSSDIKMETEGEYLINSFIGANDSPAVIEGNKATYKDVFPKTNVERIFKNTELKQNIILKEPGHPTEFREKIESSLEVKIENGNSLVYYKGKKKIATTPPIKVIDANGFEEKVSLKLENNILTITLPETRFLAYPLIIDPSTTVYAAGGDDTSVQRSDDGYGNITYTSWPNDTYTRVHCCGGESFRSYLRFSLSGIIGPVTSASLNLFGSPYMGGQMTIHHSVPMNPASDSGGALWGTGTYNAITTSTPGGGWNSYNVTTDTEEDRSAGKSYAYFQLLEVAEASINFYSANYGSYTPYLSITYVTVPNPPSNFAGSALSTSSIRWTWTDNSSDETGFRVHDQSDVLKATLGTNVTQWDEGSLTANTSYTRHAHAYNANGNSAASNQITKYTLAAAPNVSANKSTSTWYPSGTTITFTNNAGFGAGGVQYYRYVWDNSATHTWSDTETQWNSGTLAQTPSSSGTYYLHIKGYNGDNVSSGTVDYGPYWFDVNPPTGTTASTPSAYRNNTDPFTVSWNGASDTGGSNLSGNYKVKYKVNSGGTWTDWFASTSATSANFGEAGSPVTITAGNTYYFEAGASDNAGNWETFAGGSGESSATIDTTAPTITSVTSNTANGPYKTGSVIDVRVIFDETVNVTGTPQITLETGDVNQVVDYSSGSGSNTLVFNYTVQAGDSASDLDYLSTNALALNSGTIKDLALNDANLTLASPGQANSLGASKNILIDTSNPGAPAVVNDGTGADIAYANSTTQLSANWAVVTDNESGLQKYQYAIGTTSGGTDTVNWTDNAITSVTKAGLTLTQGQTYYFSVRAVDNAGNIGSAANSNGQMVDTINPGAPATVNDGTGADITYTNSTTQLSANWSQVVDNESGLQKYQYAIGTTPGGTEMVSWTDNATTSVTKTGLTLTDTQTYYFSVKAVDNAGNTGSATNSNGVTVDSTLPTTPTVTSTNAPIHSNENTWYNSNNVSLNFSSTDTGGSGVAGYSYSWTQEGTDPDDTLDGSSPATYNSQADGLWHFKVKAKDNAENWSSIKDFVVRIDVTGPQAGSPVFAANGLDDTKIRLSWGKYIDPSSGVKEYKIYRSTASNTPESTQTTDPGLAEPRPSYANLVATVTDTGAASYTYDDINLSQGWYYYRIEAWDNATDSNMGAYSYSHSKTNFVPDAITNFQVNASAGPVTITPLDSKTVTLSWSTTDPDSASDIATVKYTVIKPDGSTQHSTASVTCPGANCSSISNGYSISGVQYTFGGSDAYGNYTIKATTIDTIGTGTHIVDSNSVTVKLTSDKPTSVSASSDRSSRIDINTSGSQWIAPNSGAGVSSYKVYRRTDNPGGSDAVWKTGATLVYSGANKYYQDNYADDNHPAQAVTYYYRVSVIDQSGNEGFLSDATSTTPPKADAPIHVVLTDNSQLTSVPPNYRIFISWDEVTADQVPDRTGYVVYRSTDGIIFSYLATISNIQTTYYLDTDVTNTSTYWYKVRTYDGSYSPVDSLIHQGIGDASGASDPQSVQPGTGDTTAPLITYAHQALSGNIGYTKTAASISIYWTTDENSDSRIDYGTTNALGSSTGYSTTVQNHQVDITGLSASTTYYFIIKSTDGSGNTAIKQDTGSVPFAVTTNNDSTAPSNPTSISAWDSNSKGIILSSGNWYNYSTPRFEWSGAADAESAISGYYVYFGTNSSADPISYQAEASPNFYTASGLSSGNTYYFRVKAKNGAELSPSAVTLFTYKYDSTPPASNVASPSNGASLNALTSISGSASDTSSNVGSVTLSVKKNSNNYYLNQSGQFVDNGGTPIWLNAQGQGSWSYNTSGVSWSDGDYTIQSKASDAVGNTESPTSETVFTFDNQGPVIQNLTKTEAITSAVFEWQTSESADAKVEFWIGGNPPQSVSDSRYLTSHTITISDLSPSTTYNYKVISKDQIGNTSESTGQFTTRSTSDVSATEQPATGSILFEWATTGNLSSSYVEYSLTVSNFDDPDRTGVKVAGQDEKVESHSVAVYDVMPFQTYNFRIKSQDAKGNVITATNQSGTFGTFFIDKVAPQITFNNQPISGNVGIDAGVSSATVKWTTNENADSVVEYRKEGETEYRTLSGDPKLVTDSHSVILKSLSSSTKYYFKIKSKDVAKNTGETQEFSFTTQSLGISEPSVSVTATSATVNWTTNIASSSQVEYQKQNTNVPSKIEGSADLINSHSVIIKGLGSGRYTYKVKSIDNDNNIAETSLLTFEIPTADTGTIGTPQAGKVEEKEITATSAKITWSSTISTTSWVDYGTASGNYTISAGNDALTTSHIVTLTGLVSDTTYYYRVRGIDANGVEYISQEYSFRALAEPSISNIQVREVKSYSAVISWDTNIRTDSGVNYSTQLPYDKREQSQDMITNHQLTLSKLQDRTTYHFQVESKDEYGHIVKSEDKTFTTPLDIEGPTLSEIKISPLSGTDSSKRGVIITWITNKEATAQVEYGTGAAGGKYDQKSPIDPNYVLSHTIIITDLEPGTTYHMRLISKDKRGNEGKSQDYTMLTQEKEESILNLILRTLEETFSWVGKVKDFLGQQFNRLFSR